MRSTRYRHEADAAKAAMLGNVAILKQRLAPATLVNDAVATAQAKAMMATEQAIDTARARPALTGSIAGGLLLLLAGKPLFRLARRKPRPEPAPDPNLTDSELAEGHPS